ncbi:mediator of RNA polymerase II transcription subunit 14-like [Ciona intestinalis]
MNSTLTQNLPRQGGMMQLGYSDPGMANQPEIMAVNQNVMPAQIPQVPPVQIQGGGTIPLSLLVDFVVHKTYHDITVMADLLPSKSDLERKISVAQFASRYRQLFIRLFSLVKWASSVDKVVKCGDISSFLDHQAMLFVDTADKLYQLSNQLVIQARLPNFSIPTAVDVLTNGSYTRLPTCIRDSVIPPKAILPSERKATLKRIQQIVLFRLVTEVIPPQIKDLAVEGGIVHLTVPGKFKALLTLMGDSDNLPWRLIKLEFLVHDKEVGGGRTLVHDLQVNYIHELVQSRLISNKTPFVDLFDILHSFSLSLQLEVLQAQAERSRSRWNKFVNVEEYSPGQKLLMSYWSLNANKPGKTRYSVTVQQCPTDSTKPLQVIHTPKLPLDDIKLVEAASHINHLSLEQLTHQVMYVRSLHFLLQVKDMLHKHRKKDQSYIVRNSVDQPVILVVPLLNNSARNSLRIYVDLQTGMLVPSLYGVDVSQLENMEKEINENQKNLLTWITTLHYQLLRQLCKNAVQHLPVVYLDMVPVLEKSPAVKDDAGRIYIRLNHHPSYYLIVEFHIAGETNNKYKLMKTSSPTGFQKLQNPRGLEIDSVVDLHYLFDQTGFEKNEDCVKELIKMISICESRIPFISLLQGIAGEEGIIHQGVYEEENLALVCKLKTLPKVAGTNEFTTEILHDTILECSFRIQERITQMWVAEILIKSLFPSNDVGVDRVMLTYDAFGGQANNPKPNVIKSFVEDWSCIVRLFGPAFAYKQAQKQHTSLPEVHSYNYKSITLKYGADSPFFVTVSWSSQEKKFKLSFGCCGHNSTSNGHCITQHYISEGFNSDPDLAKLLYVLKDTSSPLQSLTHLPTTPLLGVNQKITIGEQVFTLTAQTATVVRVTFFSSYSINIYLHSHGKVSIQDGAFSQFDYSKVKNGSIPIPGLCSFLGRFQEQNEVRYKSDTEKDNPPSPDQAALNSSQNMYGLVDVSPASWSGSQPTVLSHAGLHSLCLKVPNVHHTSATQLEMFFAAAIVKRHLVKCVRAIEVGPGVQAIIEGSDDSLSAVFIARSLQFTCQPHPQHLRLVLSVQRAQQENWSQDDLQTLEKYFDARIAGSPYRYNVVASYVNMIFAPSHILRDFIHLMRLELTGRNVTAMQPNIKWNMSLCLTSPPRVPLLLGQPSILIKDKVLMFVQLTQAIQQTNAPGTIVVPFLHERQNNLVQVLPHAMSAQTQQTRNLQHVSSFLKRLEDIRNQQTINDPSYLTVTVRYLMENLTFP